MLSDDDDDNKDDESKVSSSVVSSEQLIQFHRNAHIQYFKSILFNVLPSVYQEVDSSRITVLYFALVGLDILGAIDTLGGKDNIIEFIYRLQIDHTAGCVAGIDDVCAGRSGFIGGSFLNCHLCTDCNPAVNDQYRSATCTNITGETESIAVAESCALADFHQGHLAMTYTSLACLLTLGDDLHRVNRGAIISGNLYDIVLLQPTDNGCPLRTQTSTDR